MKDIRDRNEVNRSNSRQVVNQGQFSNPNDFKQKERKDKKFKKRKNFSYTNIRENWNKDIKNANYSKKSYKKNINLSQNSFDNKIQSASSIRLSNPHKYIQPPQANFFTNKNYDHKRRISQTPTPKPNFENNKYFQKNMLNRKVTTSMQRIEVSDDGDSLR